MRRSQPRINVARLSLTVPLLAMIALAAGCQSTGSQNRRGYWLAPGSTMTLLVPVQIPPNRTKAELRRDARAKRGSTVRCLLEVRDLTGESRIIPPGDYRNEKTRIGRDVFVDAGNRYLLASSGPLKLASERPIDMLTITSYYFSSGQPANLYRLACSRQGSQGNYLAADQIAALYAGVLQFSAASE